jgi:prolipoprotein diacylglyceryltransferase
VLTLVFGAVYGLTRVVEDFLRVDKRVFGMTGSQWTGLTVSIVCIVTLIVWAVRKPSPDAAAEPGPEPDTEPASTRRPNPD